MSGYQRLSYNLDETNFVRNENSDYFVVVAIPTRALPESTLTAAQRKEISSHCLYSKQVMVLQVSQEIFSRH